LGGGGLGQLWGATTREECVATVKAAVDAGITLIDLAPRYGDGKAEQVVGEAFGGRLPSGIRVTSKCNLGNPAPDRIERILRQSIEASLRLTQLDRLDVFFLHSNIVPRGNPMWRRVDTTRFVPLEVFQDTIRPLFEKFVT
jgi:aryl-alcohol dehydrogenase-like predicted oxidoreductase